MLKRRYNGTLAVMSAEFRGTQWTEPHYKADAPFWRMLNRNCGVWEKMNGRQGIDALLRIISCWILFPRQSNVSETVYLKPRKCVPVRRDMCFCRILTTTVSASGWALFECPRAMYDDAGAFPHKNLQQRQRATMWCRYVRCDVGMCDVEIYDVMLCNAMSIYMNSVRQLLDLNQRGLSPVDF